MNIIKGSSVEAQIRHVDTILGRMYRRLNRRVVAMVPRVPIFGNVVFDKTSGVVLKCVAPAKGKIVRCRVVIVPNAEVGVKKKFEFSATISNPNGVIAHNFTVKSGSISVPMDLEVSEGDFIIIKATNPEEIDEMVASMVYEVTGRDTITKKFLIEELDRGTDEGIREDNS